MFDGTFGLFEEEPFDPLGVVLGFGGVPLAPDGPCARIGTNGGRIGVLGDGGEYGQGQYYGDPQGFFRMKGYSGTKHFRTSNVRGHVAMPVHIIKVVFGQDVSCLDGVMIPFGVVKIQILGVLV